MGLTPEIGRPLGERKLWIPQMSWGGAVAFAAAFRSIGIDAEACPDGGASALDLGARHTSGEECLPARSTLGNFLQVIGQPGFRADRTAFFMPTADGPCRFGQYAPYITRVLRNLSLNEVTVFAPSSRDGYGDIGTQARELMRTAYRGLVCADLLRKMLHRTRPYEVHEGDTDAIHQRAIIAVEGVLERPGVPSRLRLRQLQEALRAARGEFRSLHTRPDRRPLIAVVGEIACRLTPSMNDDVIREIERTGGECVLAHIVEWVWYTNVEHQSRLRREGRVLSMAMLAARISDFVQHRDERCLTAVFADDLRGYEEPSTREVLRYSEPYLPSEGALGEMTLSVGKAIYHYHQGCDGVIDVAPFGCMNGIVTEAIYPRVSANCDNMPIRNFFFDGTRRSLGSNLGVFMELARSYAARKKILRDHPPGYPGGEAVPGG